MFLSENVWALAWNMSVGLNCTGATLHSYFCRIKKKRRKKKERRTIERKKTKGTRELNMRKRGRKGGEGISGEVSLSVDSKLQIGAHVVINCLEGRLDLNFHFFLFFFKLGIFSYVIVLKKNKNKKTKTKKKTCGAGHDQ
jgi:hypothetical protein